MPPTAPPSTPVPGLRAEMIETLRRGFPLELDAMGRLVFEGDEITHPRVVNFFRAAFDLNDAGQPILSFEGQWTYLNPHDCVFRVLAVLGGPPHLPRLRLDDGRQVVLDPSHLSEDATGLRTTVPARQSGRPLSARFTNAALMQLSEWTDANAVSARATLCFEGARVEVPPFKASSLSG